LFILINCAAKVLLFLCNPVANFLTLQNYKKLQNTPKFWDILHVFVMNDLW